MAALVVLGAIGYLSYYKFNNKESMQTNNTEAKANINLPELNQNLKTLKKQTVKTGTGRVIKKGDIVYVVYAGFLPNGKVFDSNVNTGKAVGFEIGVGKLIKGWDEGLVGLKEGTELILDVPADMAYGEKGVPNVIPPNTPLRFDILIVKVLDKKEAQKNVQEPSKNSKTGQQKQGLSTESEANNNNNK